MALAHCIAMEASTMTPLRHTAQTAATQSTKERLVGFLQIHGVDLRS